jgi:photosystem II stability/assembly factor-like uncharacterized protein
MITRSLRWAVPAFAFLAGCATAPTPDPQRITVAAAHPAPITPGHPEQCQGLNGLGDQEVAYKLDIAELMLRQLREIGKTDNEGACNMPYEARNKIMAEYRNKFRTPIRKAVRPASKEFNRLWDADDFGNQPDTNQILAADASRKSLAYRGIRPDDVARGPKGVPMGISLTGAGVTSATWTAIGPGNIGGRIRSVLIDPRNANRLLVGSVTGGIWLSTDAGQSFNPVIDLSSNIAIGAMAYAPTNPDIVFAGTGESFQGFTGIGVYKSTDAGLTWSFLNSTSTANNSHWVTTNRVAVSPANASIVMAANSGGLYRSIDGGTNWARVLADTTANNPAILDVKFDPNNALNAVASGRDGFMYFSRDAGATWSPSAKLVAPTSANSARAEIAYAKSVPDLVYISLDNNSGEIWSSADGGQSWTSRSTPGHLGTQGDYANTIWVDPLDESNIVVGGLDLHRSADKGATFGRISTWQTAGPGQPQPHADHHAIVSGPNYSAATPIVYFGNDGGLYRSTNILTADPNTTSTWVNLNNGLAVTQFYGGAGKRSAGGKIIGGTQDNGTIYRFSDTGWDRFAGGDGGFVAVDPVSDNTLYGEYVYASIHRTVGLSDRRYICTGITEAQPGNQYCGADNPTTPQANFIAPFIIDPNSRDRMLVGANSLWASNNVRDLVVTWAAIKVPVASDATTRHFISAVAAHSGDGNIIWVGYNTTGQIWKTTNGLSPTPTWQMVSAGNTPINTVNRITIDQSNSNRVLVAYSGFASNRLWETTDGGATWHSITGNLPAVTLHDVKRHPSASNWLYVAAANGVYTSEDGGATWGTSNDGPSGVRVRELFWYDNQTLIAATFGRGMFQATATAPLPPLGPLSKRGGIDIDGQGKSQLVVRSGSAQMLAGRFANSTFSFSAIADPGAAYTVIATGDLNGNGKSDLVFQSVATDGSGRVTVSAWLDFQSTSPVTLRAVNPAWVVQASGDLDGDGFGDLTFRFTGDDGVPNDTGVSYNWFQQAGGAYNSVRKRGGAPLSWTLLGAADLNGDGAADIIYISPTGIIKALMATPSRTCANLTVTTTLPAGFTALKMADFTGNRRGDILIRDGGGNTQLISLNGNGLTLPPYTANPDDINASCTASALTVAGTIVNLPTADPTWSYYASGDFDGDGIFDVVWKKADGTLVVWLMKANGTPTVISNAGTAPAGYTPIALQ